jgi:hypothetical protein
MRFGYFLLKIVGSDGGTIEDWDLLDFSEVSVDVDDPDSATEAIAALSRWGDERLASHTGHYELFNICLASCDEEEEDGGFPHRVIAEEYRVMVSGKRLNTADVTDVRTWVLVTPG